MKIIYTPLLILLAFLTCQQTNISTPTASENMATMIKSRDLAMKADSFSQGGREYHFWLDSAIKVYPRNGWAYQKKSVGYTKQGNIVKAFEMLDKACQYAPEELGYRGWLKLYWYRDYEGAIEDLEKFDALTPNTTDYAWGENLYYLTALAKKQMGQYKAAIADFDKCISETTALRGEKWVDNKAFLYRGISKAHLQDIEGAMHDFNTALSYYDSSAELYYQKGLLLAQQGNAKEACSCFQKSLTYFQQGYRYEEKYSYEVFDELYEEHINEAIQLYCQ